MKGEKQLREIEEWFKSGEAHSLIAAYMQHHEYGTSGVLGHEEAKPAVVNERGVLRPERFQEYMEALQARVKRALESKQEMRPSEFDQTLPILLSTLRQMIDSVSLPGEPFQQSGKSPRELFGNGRKMGHVLDKYWSTIGVQRSKPGSSGRAFGY